MANKIFHAVLTVAVVVLLTSVVIFMSVLYPYFGSIQQSQLKDTLRLASEAVEQLGSPYLEGLSYDRYRLTWVDADGTVLFDSYADPVSMENHLGREEIREALAIGSGSSIRRSATQTQETVYEAVRLSDGTVLRAAVSRATALTLVLGLIQPMLLVLILAIALSAWLSHRMAKRVVEPLNRLDLDNPLENDVYPELSPLLHRIHSQRQEINRQVRALKRKQEEFDQITGSMKEGLVLLDRTGRILSINPAAKHLFGAGEDCVGADFLSVDRKQEMQSAMKAAMETGHASFHAERNGRRYQFDLSRIDSEGTVHGLVILAFDITERENAEQNRREFTANVSHELKTPLQSIIGSAELMENGIVKPEDLPRFVGHIRKEATRLVLLIDDIIRLSQLDEGTEMPREAVSLRAVAQEVRETLADAAGQKQITVEVSGDEGVIQGVPRLLDELVYNLCDNAIKYNRNGGRVEISVTDQPRSVTLRVQDNGIGIPPEHQEKVFERFYRVDKSHSRQSGGTGLGLSIVKHAAAYHHGKLEIRSEPGRGTAITVTFPREAPELTEA